MLREAGVVAAGECGLDYYRNYSPPNEQRLAFSRQLALAAECKLPLFLHQRDAHADFTAALREYGRDLRGVAHCFTGGESELMTYLELGLHIGITGWICDERRGQPLQALVARIPEGRLLLETDGPYLLPRDLRPRPALRRNEPAFLPHIAATVARLRGESLEHCMRPHQRRSACPVWSGRSRLNRGLRFHELAGPAGRAEPTPVSAP